MRFKPVLLKGHLCSVIFINLHIIVYLGFLWLDLIGNITFCLKMWLSQDPIFQTNLKKNMIWQITKVKPQRRALPWLWNYWTGSDNRTGSSHHLKWTWRRSQSHFKANLLTLEKNKYVGCCVIVNLSLNYDWFSKINFLLLLIAVEANM